MITFAHFTPVKRCELIWHLIQTIFPTTRIFFSLVLVHSVVFSVASFDYLNIPFIECVFCSMEGSDICFEVVRRAIAGFIYSEAVAW